MLNAIFLELFHDTSENSNEPSELETFFTPRLTVSLCLLMLKEILFHRAPSSCSGIVRCLVTPSKAKTILSVLLVDFNPTLRFP